MEDFQNKFGPMLQQLPSQCRVGGTKTKKCSFNMVKFK